jgi:hypothetical protein
MASNSDYLGNQTIQNMPFSMLCLAGLLISMAANRLLNAEQLNPYA